MTPLDHDLRRERDFHDLCRTTLHRMADGAAERVVTGEDVSASGADAEALGYRLRSHARELREEPPGPLFFGRLDHTDGRSHHIGRRRIGAHPAEPPLVVDWRAPVARAFYQARRDDPRGVAVRRRFGWAPYSEGDSADLTGLEDEHLALPAPAPGTAPGAERGAAPEAALGDGAGADRVPDAGLGDGLRGAGAGRVPDARRGAGAASGPGAACETGTATGGLLAAEIERPRVGPMRDIAATIQPEQDDLVRAPLSASLCVQGAPGTGKTAVGLHRAAYLLYTHPRRVQRGGLLILGPNRAFLAYVSEVLPALGERDVRQTTVDEEVARTVGHEPRAEDTDAAAAVKHDARMAAVLHRALYARVAPPTGELAVPDGAYRWRVPADELAALVAEVRAEAPPYLVGRERLRSRVVRALRARAERRAGPVGAAWERRAGRSRPVAALLDACWPRATPEQVLAEVLADPRDPVLTGAERAAIRWARPPRSYRSARWTAADLVLLDELAAALERPAGYGHIVVDEAQDLSPMQCRAVARRTAASGSLTVLGDLAQGTAPWAARDWREQLAHLGRPDARVTALTAGYRVPGAVVELANRLLAALPVDVPPARSVRRDGEVTVRAVDVLEAAVVDAVRAALAREGSVGVVVADAAYGRTREVLAAAGVPAGHPGEVAADAPRVTVVPAGLAKGLEYDHVILAEPAAVAGGDPRGLSRLYVALTRAVSRLDVLHARPLPPELRAE
ncbi:HelD family protein [Streptomyces rubrolavendulae]|uniref:Helicase IV n=1 Tax=Streptomyces rubrolavendulae TaxID=285473 RepID=A0A1D8G2I7_9ACTN|nr:AAA family ATPase [Streptomyces rubrolavendulae]AOT59667.1 Helicase IV [Streptomyces rubrolavendulae]